MFIEIFTSLCLLLVILSILIYKRKFAPIIEKTRDWPALPILPIVGCAHALIGLAPDDILMYIWDVLKQHCVDRTAKFWFGLEVMFFIGRPEDVEIVLTSPACIDKAENYKALNDWLREGLLISKGKKWYQRRKMLTPAFHFSILKDYVEISERQSRRFVEKLERYAASGTSFDIFKHGGQLTLDVICETAMGVAVNAQADDDSKYVKAVRTISNVTHRRMLDFMHYFYIIHRFTKLAREGRDALKILHSFTENVIQKRRTELLRSQQIQLAEQFINETDGIRRKMSFLDLLLQSRIDGQPLTDIEIREEVDTFMFEGHDTTSSAIGFFFYNMAIYPEYQQKCFEEIFSIFGEDKSKPTTYDDLNKLHFIELCIKETLRLYPSVPIIGRQTTADIRLSDGKIVPANTAIVTMILYIGRLNEHFADAEAFKPERFDGETSFEKLNPFTFVPFSAGQRNCIGQKFALLELKAIIVNVLRNFIVEYDGDPEKPLHLTGELILRTKNPIMLKVRKRDY